LRKNAVKKLREAQLEINDMAVLASIFKNEDRALETLSELENKISLAKRSLEYNNGLWEILRID